MLAQQIVDRADVGKRSGFSTTGADCAMNRQRLRVEVERLPPLAHRMVDQTDVVQRCCFSVAGADRALAIIDMRGRGHESGVPVEMQFGQIWTFRDGRAIRMEMYNDPDEARREAGLA